MGHFIGQRLGYLIVNAIAKRLCVSKSLLEILSMDNGFFFFKFRNLEAVETILEGGSWHMVNRPFFLRK